MYFVTMSNEPKLNDQQKVAKSTNLLWLMFIIPILGGIALQFILNSGSLFNKSGANVAIPAGTINQAKSTITKDFKIDVSKYTSTESKPSDTKMDGMMMGGSMSSMTDRVFDDESFLTIMIPHHEEAIESSRQILKTTTNPELKAFAERVVTDQIPETTKMITILNSRYQPDSSYVKMMKDLSNGGKEVDQLYINDMIIHHQGAVDMANKILTITKSDEIKVLASGISTGQSAQIKQLEGLGRKI